MFVIRYLHKYYRFKICQLTTDKTKARQAKLCQLQILGFHLQKLKSIDGAENIKHSLCWCTQVPKMMWHTSIQFIVFLGSTEEIYKSEPWCQPVGLTYFGCLKPMETSYHKFFHNGQGWRTYGNYACISPQFHMKVAESHARTVGYRINSIVS